MERRITLPSAPPALAARVVVIVTVNGGETVKLDLPAATAVEAMGRAVKCLNALRGVDDVPPAVPIAD